LPESVNEEVIFHEIRIRGFNYQRKKGIPVVYDNIRMELGFRADLIVEKKIIVEIKSLKAVAPVHHKQLLTNLKAGLLVNFKC